MSRISCENCMCAFASKKLLKSHRAEYHARGAEVGVCAPEPGDDVPPPETPLGEVLRRCVDMFAVRGAAERLGVSTSTVRRWQEKDGPPAAYALELRRAAEMPIDYSEYTFAAKDQFYTPEAVVRRCWAAFIETVRPDVAAYVFIEPAAGNGSFLAALPAGSIAMDVEPLREDIQAMDYLAWTPPDAAAKYVVFGAPPVGVRCSAALRFLRHSRAFAAYVCFVLPKAFASSAKGGPRSRVEGYALAHCEPVAARFAVPYGPAVSLDMVFQIWANADIS